MISSAESRASYGCMSNSVKILSYPSSSGLDKLISESWSDSVKIFSSSRLMSAALVLSACCSDQQYLHAGICAADLL